MHERIYVHTLSFSLSHTHTNACMYACTSRTNSRCCPFVFKRCVLIFPEPKKMRTVYIIVLYSIHRYTSHMHTGHNNNVSDKYRERDYSSSMYTFVYSRTYIYSTRFQIHTHTHMYIHNKALIFRTDSNSRKCYSDQWWFFVKVLTRMNSTFCGHRFTLS